MGDPWGQLLTGQQLGRYRLGERVGGGGFGVVFRAEDSSSGDVVAVKVLLPSSRSGDVLEFENEVALLGKLAGCSRVVTLLDQGDAVVQLQHAPGLFVPVPLQYLAMDLAAASLEQLIVRRGELEWIELISLWRDVVLGVHQMHLKQVAHRDLKSANCLVFPPRGDRAHSELGDLGRSRDLSQLARYGPLAYIHGMGDLRFAPPEFHWAQGESTSAGHRAADLYGVGSVLFELVTGVALTAMAVPYDPELLEENRAARLRGVTIDLGALLGRYAPAYEVFHRSVPRVIADDATRVLRQLTHPDPQRRFRANRLGRLGGPEQTLQWVLRMADIMVKQLVVAERDQRRQQKKGSS